MLGEGPSVLVEACDHQKKSLVLILVKQAQSVA